MRQDHQREQHDSAHPRDVGTAPVPRLLGRDGATAADQGTVTYPRRVLAVIQIEDLADEERALADGTDLWEDAYWWSFVTGAFSWSRFMQWWIERRWLVPRDVRKR